MHLAAYYVARGDRTLSRQRRKARSNGSTASICAGRKFRGPRCRLSGTRGGLLSEAQLGVQYWHPVDLPLSERKIEVPSPPFRISLQYRHAAYQISGGIPEGADAAFRPTKRLYLDSIVSRSASERFDQLNDAVCNNAAFAAMV